MRKLIITIAAVLVFGVGALAQDQKQSAPVVCVAAVPDRTGKAIGPLGTLNDDLAKEISDRRKPLKGLAVQSDMQGRALPSEECDYMLEISLHVGAGAAIALNPPKPNPYDPTVDSRGATSSALVRATYHLTPTKKAAKSITLEDDAKEQYDPNVVGYGQDLQSVAKRLAHSMAYEATGRLKKKLKI